MEKKWKYHTQETFFSSRIKATRLKHLYSSLKLIGYHHYFILLICLSEESDFFGTSGPHCSSPCTTTMDQVINRTKTLPTSKCDFFFSETLRSLMSSRCDEAIGPNEAEDLLTLSSPISCPALFEETT